MTCNRRVLRLKERRSDEPLLVRTPTYLHHTDIYSERTSLYLGSGQQVTIPSSMQIQERARKSSEHVISTSRTHQAQNKLAKSAPMLEAEVLPDLASVFSLFSLDYTRPMPTLPKSPSLYLQNRTMNSASSTMHTATNLIASASWRITLTTTSPDHMPPIQDRATLFPVHR